MKKKGLTDDTYAVGARVAFDIVVRLICRACSLTLDFASTIEKLAAGTTVDWHRPMVADADFGAPGMRILDAGNAILIFFVLDYDRCWW